MMVDAPAGVLEPKTALSEAPQPIAAGRLRGWLGDWRLDWLDRAGVGLPVIALVGLIVVFIVIPRLTQKPSPPGSAAGPSVTPCSPTSATPPQVSASPNPATAGQPVSFAASGFQANDPLFIVIDRAADCTNPTAGAKVYNTSSYADPVQTEPSPLSDAVTPGSYQLRACNQRPGEQPANCVQVPFTGAAAPSPAPAQTPSPAPSPPPG